MLVFNVTGERKQARRRVQGLEKKQKKNITVSNELKEFNNPCRSRWTEVRAPFWAQTELSDREELPDGGSMQVRPVD